MNKTEDISSIDQILEKIKKAINEDTKNSENTANFSQKTSINQEVLELTNVVPIQTTIKDSEDRIDQRNSGLLSKHITNFTRKLNLLLKGNYVMSEKEVREIFKETLRPYLKSWLNNNLEDMVKEVLEMEIKKMFQGLYNNMDKQNEKKL